MFHTIMLLLMCLVALLMWPLCLIMAIYDWLKGRGSLVKMVKFNWRIWFNVVKEYY